MNQFNQIKKKSDDPEWIQAWLIEIWVGVISVSLHKSTNQFLLLTFEKKATQNHNVFIERRCHERQVLPDANRRALPGLLPRLSGTNRDKLKTINIWERKKRLPFTTLGLELTADLYFANCSLFLLQHWVKREKKDELKYSAHVCFPSFFCQQQQLMKKKKTNAYFLWHGKLFFRLRHLLQSRKRGEGERNE